MDAILTREQVRHAVLLAKRTMKRSTELDECEKLLLASDHLHTSILATFKGGSLGDAGLFPTGMRLSEVFPKKISEVDDLVHEEFVRADEAGQKFSRVSPLKNQIANTISQHSANLALNELTRNENQKSTSLLRSLEFERLCAFAFDCVEHARFSMGSLLRHCAALENVDLKNVETSFSQSYVFYGPDEMGGAFFDRSSEYYLDDKDAESIYSRYKQLKSDFHVLRKTIGYMIARSTGVFAKQKVVAEAEKLVGIADSLAISNQYLLALEILVLLQVSVETANTALPLCADVQPAEHEARLS
jgi:hypothetical protein